MFLEEFAKSNKESIVCANEGEHSAEIGGFTDSGCYLLNALLSGSIYGGLPEGRVTALAGESSSGKSFISLGIVKQFLDANDKAGVVYCDTEAAITKDMLIERNIDAKRVFISEPKTIEDFRIKIKRILDAYAKVKEEDRTPLMIVLDSLGMLSSSKEIGDVEEGKETRDMTKAGLIRGTFRVLTLQLARLNIPFIIVSHTYQVVGAYVPTKEMSGGGGTKYAASQIVFLTKSKDREDSKVVGNLIKATLTKGRITKENSQVTLKLSYEKGLDKYYGLLDLGEKHGIFKQVGKYWQLPDGSKQYAKTIYNDPEKYFTKEILDQLDEAARKEFSYGTDTAEEEPDDEE